MVRYPFAALAVALIASAPALAESIDNPAFKTWAAQKKGTAVTMKMTSDVSGQKSETTVTSTLTEISAETATLELVSVIKVGPMEFKTPPTKLEVKKTLELPAGKKKEDFEKPEGLVDSGTETLKIDGVEYKTKWTKVKTTINEMAVEAKTWTCDDVPNQIVKSETKVVAKQATSVTLMELVSVKKP